MRSLPPPVPTIYDALDACIGKIGDPHKKAGFVSVRPALVDSDRDMRVALAAHKHSTLRSAHFAAPSPLKPKDMIWLYDRRLVKSARGRDVYDTLQLAAGKDCPLCGQRDVSTLDHYFPKAAWPALAVAPANLLPACQPCNKIKSDSAVLGLHPYFDEPGSARWLIAAPVMYDPMTVEFHIRPPASWSTDLHTRMANHFDTLELGPLYSQHAGKAMREVKRRLAKLYSTLGTAAVVEHLREEADSVLGDNPNSWRGALFEALASSPAYYSGAFRNI